MRSFSLFAAMLAAACGARPDLTEPVYTGGGGGAGGDAQGGAGGSGNQGGSGNAGNQGGAGNQGNQGGSGNAGNQGGSGNVGNQGGAGNQGGQGNQGGSVEICDSFNACTQCLSTHCPKVYCDCYQNFDCFDLFDCWGNCFGNESCQQQCLAAYPNGIADVGLVSDCAATECPGCGWGQELQPCGECIYTDCKPTLNACLSAPQCLGLWQCLNECPPVNVVCQQGCYDQYPDGAPLLQPVIDCAGSACAAECPN